MTLVQLNHKNMHAQEMQKTFSLLLYLFIKRLIFYINSHIYIFFDAHIVNQNNILTKLLLYF